MRLRLYRVTGDSMLPDLAAGSYVVTLAHRCQAIRIGDVAVVDRATHGRIIKRVVGVDRHRALLLAGDNADRSTSTDALGPVARKRLLGRVIWRFGAPSGKAHQQTSALP